MLCAIGVSGICHQCAIQPSRYSPKGLTGNKGWKPVWREPDPKPEYDIIIIGGGRPRAVDGLLPGQGVRHHQCRRAGKRLAGLGQYRAEHHDHPLQLHAARKRAFLRIQL